ncbi:hypothetical protein UT300007_25010 [Clostridium sp. CTA-7]
MNNDLSCNVVKDLLPIYLDGIASEETNIYVKKHLSECQLCLNEYKKFYEITEKKNKIVVNEASSIIRFKKRIAASFITVVISSILLISLAMFCFHRESIYNNPTIFEFFSLIVLYIGMYFLPLLGLFVSIIWKQIINKKDSSFWPNVIILLLGIWILVEILLLLWHFFVIIRGY